MTQARGRRSRHGEKRVPAEMQASTGGGGGALVRLSQQVGDGVESAPKHVVLELYWSRESSARYDGST